MSQMENATRSGWESVHYYQEPGCHVIHEYYRHAKDTQYYGNEPIEQPSLLELSRVTFYGLDRLAGEWVHMHGTKKSRGRQDESGRLNLFSAPF